MEKETKYGVLSDIHENPKILPYALDALKKEGAEKLIVNGDIGTIADNLEDSQRFTAYILDNIAKTGIESYIQPGSHETIGAFESVLDYFKEKNKNIIDVKENPKIDSNNHSLIFLPGSDWNVSGGEYTLTDNNIETGFYHIPQKQGPDQYRYYKNMNDLEKQLTEPEKTIAVSHIPRKFNNIENCVDVAEFGEIQKDFFADIVNYEDGEQQIRVYEKNGENGTILKPKPVKEFIRNQSFEKGGIFPSEIAKYFQSFGAPIEIKKENRGNESLKNLYEKSGITKAVSGHFHESGHRANDSKGNHVEPGKYTNELFWNSGYLDVGQTGILKVKDNKVSYDNIQLR